MGARLRPGITRTISMKSIHRQSGLRSYSGISSSGLAMGPGRNIATAAVKEYRIPPKLLLVDPLYLRFNGDSASGCVCNRTHGVGAGLKFVETAIRCAQAERTTLTRASASEPQPSQATYRLEGGNRRIFPHQGSHQMQPASARKCRPD